MTQGKKSDGRFDPAQAPATAEGDVADPFDQFQSRVIPSLFPTMRPAGQQGDTQYEPTYQTLAAGASYTFTPTRTPAWYFVACISNTAEVYEGPFGGGARYPLRASGYVRFPGRSPYLTIYNPGGSTCDFVCIASASPHVFYAPG